MAGVAERESLSVSARDSLRRFAVSIAVLETLEELWIALQAKSAGEEWRADPSTLRPWREVLAELGYHFSDEKALDRESTGPCTPHQPARRSPLRMKRRLRPEKQPPPQSPLAAPCALSDAADASLRGLPGRRLRWT